MQLQFHKLVRISSRDVVKALGFFVHEQGTDRGRPAIELEWIDGEDFDAWASGADVHKHLQAVARVAEALADLHDEALAHGDLYFGGNVRVTKDRVVLIDVGSDLERWSPRDADRGSLANVIEKLLSAYVKTSLAGVLRDLRDPGANRLPMRDVASQLMSVARNAPLVDLSGPLFTAAVDSHKEMIAKRESRYHFIRRQRALTIDRLSAEISQLATPFGFPVGAPKHVEAPGPPTAAGNFFPRTIDVASDFAPNLRWIIQFESVDGFTKPNPYYGGIVARGKSWIASDFGRHRDDLIEIRLENDTPVIYVAVNPEFEATNMIRSSLERQIATRNVDPQWVVQNDEWFKQCLAALTGKSVER